MRVIWNTVEMYEEHRQELGAVLLRNVLYVGYSLCLYQINVYELIKDIAL